MELIITIDDPKVYLKPWTVKTPLNLLPNAELLDAFCDSHDKTIEHRRITPRCPSQRVRPFPARTSGRHIVDKRGCCLSRIYDHAVVTISGIGLAEKIKKLRASSRVHCDHDGTLQRGTRSLSPNSRSLNNGRVLTDCAVGLSLHQNQTTEAPSFRRGLAS